MPNELEDSHCPHEDSSELSSDSLHVPVLVNELVNIINPQAGQVNILELLGVTNGRTCIDFHLKVDGLNLHSGKLLVIVCHGHWTSYLSF